MSARTTPLDFLKYHNSFREGETPQKIQKTLEESAERRADVIFNSLNKNQSDVETLVKGWVEEVKLLSSPEDLKKNLDLLTKRIDELNEYKTHLSTHLVELRDILRAQQSLRSAAIKTVNEYQLILQQTPNSFPQESSIIQGGNKICAFISRETS